MYSFTNDYSEGAHPQILEALVTTNLEQSPGYGCDSYTEKAKNLIREQIGLQSADVHLFVGGTQVNLTGISAFLRPHEAAICPHTGHINVHETGAIEATGHKVLTVQSDNGKITPNQLQEVLDQHTDEHMVKPRLVYISNSTEIGTIYQKCELQQLHSFCKEHNLLLYLDGARLGSALTSSMNDLTLNDLATYCDAFYIGGTKNGALFGEAFVICNDQLKTDFRYFIKQRGGLLAKGRLLGIQFTELFKDGLFFTIGKHANETAMIIKDGIQACGYPFLVDSYTNQQFPILPNYVVEELSKKYTFTFWSNYDENHSVLRLVTSFATTKEQAHAFVQDLKIITI